MVLSSHPDFAEAIRSGLNAEQYRVVHRQNVEEGEPLLVHGLMRACMLDADLMGVECVWIIERLRRRDAKTPIIAYTELPQSDWEEEAFLRGVTHILTKPVRPRLFNSILDRLWAPPAAAPAARAERARRQHRHLYPRRRGSQRRRALCQRRRRRSMCCAISPPS